MTTTEERIVLVDPITGRKFTVPRLAEAGGCGFGEDGFLVHSECDRCRWWLTKVVFLDEA